VCATAVLTKVVVQTSLALGAVLEDGAKRGGTGGAGHDRRERYKGIWMGGKRKLGSLLSSGVEWLVVVVKEVCGNSGNL
jgi:hypothetical protein